MSTKGPPFEREIAHSLSRWWTGGERDDLAWRTAGSGARATTRAKKGKSTANAAGDLAATDHLIQPLFDLFAFELKRGLNYVSAYQLLDSPNRKLRVDGKCLDGWVHQARRSQANSKAKLWAIVHRADRQAAMVYLDGLEVATILGPTWAATAARFASVRGDLKLPGGGTEPLTLWVVPFDEMFPSIKLKDGPPLFTPDHVRAALQGSSTT